MLSTLEILRTNLKTEQQFQDVSKKEQCDENLENSVHHFSHYFIKIPSPKKCHKIMNVDIICTVNPIGSMKDEDKLSCTLCMK